MKQALLAAACLLGVATAAHAQRPDLSGNWIANGGKTIFGEWHLTAEGERRFKAYDFKKDDPALKCIGTSWTRVWLNPNVVVRITQGDADVRLQYEWMDIDRRVPIVDPAAPHPKRTNIPGMPGLGYSAAWYDGNALVIETNDIHRTVHARRRSAHHPDHACRPRQLSRAARRHDYLSTH